MKTQDDLNRLYDEFKASSFNRSFYQVDMPFEDVILASLRYLDKPTASDFEGGKITAHDAAKVVLNSAPDFQRDNDKWSPNMQSSYVRNVLRGMRSSPIMLYRIGNKSSGPCKIIDGLQRMTALMRFFCDDTMPIESASGEVFTSADIRNSEAFRGYMWNLIVPARVYSFRSEIEAVNFYIEMNEGITHSEADIKKARDYLMSIS